MRKIIYITGATVFVALITLSGMIHHWWDVVVDGRQG
jgi:hypothetical protein